MKQITHSSYTVIAFYFESAINVSPPPKLDLFPPANIPPLYLPHPTPYLFPPSWNPILFTHPLSPPICPQSKGDIHRKRRNGTKRGYRSPHCSTLRRMSNVRKKPEYPISFTFMCAMNGKDTYISMNGFDNQKHISSK